ncbi:hypothetical protein VDGL01_00610 [Verticillium dahliae]
MATRASVQGAQGACPKRPKYRAFQRSPPFTPPPCPVPIVMECPESPDPPALITAGAHRGPVWEGRTRAPTVSPHPPLGQERPTPH